MKSTVRTQRNPAEIDSTVQKRVEDIDAAWTSIESNESNQINLSVLLPSQTTGINRINQSVASDTGYWFHFVVIIVARLSYRI
jgi:hypothetical protein